MSRRCDEGTRTGGVCRRCAQRGGLDELGPAGDDTALGDGVCRHHCAYPERLRDDPLAPSALRIRGGAIRLRRLLCPGVVAIVGASRASDYGMAIALRLAGGLAAHGATVATALGEGISLAALDGAVRAGGATAVVTREDVGRCSPAWCGALYGRALARGCAVSEIGWQASTGASRLTEPLGSDRGTPAPARILALLADLVIVVEARTRGEELACAEICRARGIPLAAVPGAVDSPTSRGSNGLLADGASVVRGVADALALLPDANARRPVRTRRSQAVSATRENPDATGCVTADGQMRVRPAGGGVWPLEPELAALFEQVRRGEDTLDALRRESSSPGALELSLIELELRGLLRRSVGGRYLALVDASVD